MSRLDDKEYKQIQEVFRQTGSIRQTSRQTGHCRKVVRRVLGCQTTTLPKAPRTHPRKSKLDSFAAKISWLVTEKRLSGVRVLEEIRGLGYDGGYSILKAHIHRIRPRQAPIPRPPIDHPPGQEAQMDWSPHSVIMGGRKTIVHTGSIVLCFSRYLFIRHFSDETHVSVIRLHEEAFAEIGAVPEIITYDNMTTVGRHIGPGQIWINPAFQRFADGYGFKVVILAPGRKERHGKVERPFRYIEDNFLKGREFTDLEDLNTRADLWRSQTANVRIHGTLRERPVDRLAREKSLLKPVPWNRSETFFKEVERRVNADFCVAIDVKRYSASPGLIGRRVKVRLFREHLEIWVDDTMDCRHLYTQGDRDILPEHETIYKTMTGQNQLLKDAFLRLGKVAEDYFEGLKRIRKSAAGYHLQRILKYADRYGSDIVAGALTHAALYDSYGADAILRIIQGKRLSKASGKYSRAPIPDNVRNWLRSCHVEKDSPGRHDCMIGNDKPSSDGDKDNDGTSA